MPSQLKSALLHGLIYRIHFVSELHIFSCGIICHIGKISNDKTAVRGRYLKYYSLTFPLNFVHMIEYHLKLLLPKFLFNPIS